MTPTDTTPIEDRDLAERLAGTLGNGTPATFGDWVDGTASLAGGEGDSVDALCTGESTRHHARVGDGEYDLHCVLDALMLPHLHGEPVEVRSQSPDGGVVELRATPEVAEAHPATAVVSFGLAGGVEAPSGDFSTRDAYEQFCPYANAFPSEAEYTAWADRTDAVTTPLSVAAAHGLAGALAGRPPLAGGD